MSLIVQQQAFVNLRLGMFVHFNSATVQFSAGELVDWEFDHENHGAPRRHPFSPRDWNPVDLDPGQWARAALALGARFGALTTKHHEGFCLWPTRTTEHCVRHAARTTDVVAEYVKAFRAAGLLPGFYFSMLDLTRGVGRRSCTRQDVQYTKDQLTELLTGYGPIPFIIFDGWNATWGGPSYETMPYQEIDAHIKTLQPDCMTLNISCEPHLGHTEVVFFENAAGQEVEADFQGPGAACHVLTAGNWFWRATDPDAALKPAEWAVQTIEEMNRRNVTFLLNASPNPRGVIDDNLLQTFGAIGQSYRRPPELTELPVGWKRRGR